MEPSDVPNLYLQSYNEVHRSCAQAVTGAPSTSGTAEKHSVPRFATTPPSVCTKRRISGKRYRRPPRKTSASAPFRKFIASAPFRRFIADKSTFKEIVHRFTGEGTSAHLSADSQKGSRPFSTSTCSPQCPNYGTPCCISKIDRSRGTAEEPPVPLEEPPSPPFRKFVVEKSNFKEIVQRFTGEPAALQSLSGERNGASPLCESAYTPPCLNHGTPDMYNGDNVIVRAIFQSLCTRQALSSYLLRQPSSRVPTMTPESSIRNVNLSSPQASVGARMSASMSVACEKPKRETEVVSKKVPVAQKAKKEGKTRD
ncbi:hypothetical protein KP509_36G044400 [Ceratopteris richardii]|uniref:VQ domain-containing protein n=1 Tax=Ceratopteris richardii TaxID=49495 RepID=A0A8T2QD39_CERRI|nr:hypothetical protein KP509_36G044400 [Ceratopteris richardii]